MAGPKKDMEAAPVREEIARDELEAIVERTTGVLTVREHGKLKAAVNTLGFLTQEIESKNASIARLRKYLFGASTDYTGATKVVVPHETLESGDPCPECPRGKVYPMQRPAVLVRITGMAPLQATVYERTRLRCNLCGEVFTAREPPGVGHKKYDEAAASMIAILKYGAGVPINRLEQLQKDFRIPLPASTQWEIVASASEKILPAYQELVRQAAQGDLIHNDDTPIQILELTGR